MNTKDFIKNYREAFGDKAQLPIAFWYSAEAAARTEKMGGCIFKYLGAMAKGATISLDAGNIGCGGGRFYCGFSDMPEYVPTFVSLKERYKQSPELVTDMVEKLAVPKAKNSFLNFSRIDHLESFDSVEGLLFLATPDVLSGLVTWATFDRNESDVVSSLFGSGCGNVVTQAVKENTADGYRSFIGFFDPSVRPYVDSNILSFTIPMSRMRVMYHTMRRSCLFDTHAWDKIRERIIAGSKSYSLKSIREKYPNAYKPWTEEDDSRLEVLFCEGMRVKELAEIFGRETGAIRSRIKKLELREKYLQ